MLITLVVWVYIALMISVSRWPDIGGMIATFLLLGALPLAFVVLLVVRGSKLDKIREQQRLRRDQERN